MLWIAISGSSCSSAARGSQGKVREARWVLSFLGGEKWEVTLDSNVKVQGTHFSSIQIPPGAGEFDIYMRLHIQAEGRAAQIRAIKAVEQLMRGKHLRVRRFVWTGASPHTVSEPTPALATKFVNRCYSN